MTTQAIGQREKRLAAAGAATADWLCLAAAPTFAIMALLAGFAVTPQDTLCSAAHGAAGFSGMAWMYMLMSAFHAAPWLKLISGRRRFGGPPALPFRPR